MEPIPVFRSAKGLTNKLSKVRVHHDASSGVVGLVTAVNIQYDQTGMPKRRNGVVPIVIGNFHSVFGAGDYGFAIEDGKLFFIDQNLVFTKLRSNLTDTPMDFCKTNQGVYYSNTYENGVVSNQTSYSWPTQSYIGPPSDDIYSPAPLGSHLTVFNGRMLIAVGRFIYYSEPHSFGLYNLASNYLPFKSDIRMIRATEHGFYVSDSDYVYFCKGNDITELDIQQVEYKPAVERTCLQDEINGYSLGMEDPSKRWVWLSVDGYIAGDPTGNTKNLTEEFFSPPNLGKRGAGIYTGSDIIQCVF